ncbi:MAG TPA: hypothetical protein VIJ72_00925 [Rhizomicrobium sp.]
MSNKIVLGIFLSVALGGAAIGASVQTIGDLTKAGYRLVSVVAGKSDGDFAAFLQKGESIYICPLQFKKDGVEFRTGPWTDYAGCEKVTPRLPVPR